jgi:hypothetical protein
MGWQWTSNCGWWWRNDDGADDNDNNTTTNKYVATEAEDGNG